MVEDGFALCIPRFDWGLFTTEDTEGHRGIQGVTSGKGLAVGGSGSLEGYRCEMDLLSQLKSVRENSVVPPGLESFFPLFPALKRWAKLGRPSGAGCSAIPFHRVRRKRVLAHTPKRCATQNQVQHRVSSAACEAALPKTIYETAFL